MVIKVEQCAKFEAIPSIMHGTPQSDPFNQFKIGQEWRVGCRKIPRLPGLMDHFSAPLYSDVVMSTMASQITGILIVYSTVCSGVLIVYSTVCSGRSKKTSKIRVTGLCEGNSPVTGEFPAVIPPNPVLVFGWHIHLLGFFFPGRKNGRWHWKCTQTSWHTWGCADAISRTITSRTWVTREYLWITSACFFYESSWLWWE